jgi:ABC-type sugar transport system permease subunit
MRRYPWPAIVVFLGPALVFYCAFIIVPVGMTFFNSLHKLQVQGAAGISYGWVGWTNYANLVEDEVFRMAVQHSLIWGLVAPLLEIPAALVLAYVL